MKNPILPNVKTDSRAGTKYIYWLVKQKLNGTVIGGVYKNAHSLFDVKCENKNHKKFKTKWFYLKRNQWCKSCHFEEIKGKYKISVADCKKMAKKRNWVFLSKHYVGPKMHMMWKCPNGHIRKMNYASFSTGNGCAVCVGNDYKVAEKNFYNQCKLKNFEVIKGYVGANKKCCLRCKNCNHIWNPVGNSISSGRHGSPRCSALKLGLSKVKNTDWLKSIAKKKKINILSEYERANKKVLALCQSGHKFLITPNSLQQGAGCTECYRERQKQIPIDVSKNVINELKKICRLKNYKLLTTTKTYKGSLKKIHVKCICGHEWYPVKSQLLVQNTGCPNCSSGVGERLTRVAFEWATNKKFPKSRNLEFLRHPKTKTILELDGYCEELKIAFEHQGVQHFKYNKFFHKNKKSFDDIQERDGFKKIKCKQNGIRLIYIPSVNVEINEDKLVKLVLSNLKKANINIKPKTKAPNWALAYIPKMKILTDEVNEIIKVRKKWVLKTKVVYKTSQKIEFFCKVHDKPFFQNIHKLRLGRGCRSCGNSKLAGLSA